MVPELGVEHAVLGEGHAPEGLSVPLGGDENEGPLIGH